MNESINNKASAESSATKSLPAENVNITKNRSPIPKLSLTAIALVIGLSGFLFYHGHQQSAQQKQTIEQLQSEITTLKQTVQTAITQEIKKNIADAIAQQEKQFTSLVNKVENQLATQIQSQQQFVKTVNDSLSVTEKNMLSFNERLGAMSNTDNNIWLISQANYLVNLAGRKIWNDQDYTTARLLLKNADTSLAQANDPSLLPARQAINTDIAALAKISFTDFDGIVMTLLALSDSVTELPLVDHYQSIDLGMVNHDDTIIDFNDTNEAPQEITIIESPSNQIETTSSDETVSFSVMDWPSNLWKSSQSFINQFIQIEKYDSFGECIANAEQNSEALDQCKIYQALITPEQSIYLRENIRLRLFIAAQAVPRHQELVYQQALSEVAIWVHAYFDRSSPNVSVFLNELTELQNQSISNVDVPEQLKSSRELDRLMQTRVRSMLAN